MSANFSAVLFLLLIIMQKLINNSLHYIWVLNDSCDAIMFLYQVAFVDKLVFCPLS